MRRRMATIGIGALVMFLFPLTLFAQDVIVHSADSPCDEVFQGAWTCKVVLDVENLLPEVVDIDYSRTKPLFFDSLNNDVTSEYLSVSDPNNPGSLPAAPNGRRSLTFWVTPDNHATVDTITVDGQLYVFDQSMQEHFDIGATTRDTWLMLANIHDAVMMISQPATPQTTFGFDVGTGDYDGDGDDDLFIGEPASAAGNGQVLVIAVGVTVPPPGCGVSTQSGGGILTAPVPQNGDGFGNALATGDVNGDGFADLLVGAQVAGAGAAYLFIADTLGWFLPAITMVNPSPQAGDRFGYSVGLFDVNNDNVGDAIVGNVQVLSGGGEVWVFLGPGYLPPVAPIVSPTPPVPSSFSFGFSVAGGDFNGDGFDDLAVGSPSEASTAGRVHVFTGPGLGLFASVTDTPFVSQTWFGWSLAWGDVTGTSLPDLVVGAIAFDVGGVINSGHVVVFPSPSLTTSFALSEPMPEFPGWLGYDVAVGDVNGDGDNDIVAGAPRSSPCGASEAGEVFVFINATSTVRYAFRPGYLEPPAAGRGFGHAVAVGEMNLSVCTVGLEVVVGSDGVTPGLPPMEEVLIFEVDL